jgi:hypothetical protein
MARPVCISTSLAPRRSGRAFGITHTMSTGAIKKMEMEVLSETTNFPVVRYPGRSFPGSLIQGDSLSIIYQLATSIRGRVKKTGDADLIDDAEELHELLKTRLRFYEETLAAYGIDLPYTGPLITKR